MAVLRIVPNPRPKPAEPQKLTVLEAAATTLGHDAATPEPVAPEPAVAPPAKPRAYVSEFPARVTAKKRLAVPLANGTMTVEPGETLILTGTPETGFYRATFRGVEFTVTVADFAK